MPNWQELVRQRLKGLALHSSETEEVHSELAAHLEDAYEALLGEGVSEPEAAKRTLCLAEDWQELRCGIQKAKAEENPMTKRVSQFWLPGSLTLLLSMSLLMLIQFFGPKPFIPSRSSWTMIAPLAVIYIRWFLLLPLIGAMGAYLSGRAGASRRLVLLSILFPVLPYLTFFLIGFPIALIVEEHVTHNIMFGAFLAGLVAWVFLPAVALLAGGLPMQFYFSRRLTQRGVPSV